MVDGRLDLAAGQQVDHHWNGTVADANALNQAFLDKLFHLLPNHMERWPNHSPVLALKVDRQDHPMDQIEV